MRAVIQHAEAVITAPVPGTTVSVATMAMGWGSEILGLAPTMVNMFTGLCGAILALVMAYINWKKYKWAKEKHEERERWTDEERDEHRRSKGRR